MSLRNLNQTLTYWPPGAVDRYGKPQPGSPVQKPCRWEDRSDQIISKTGQEIVSKSRVFLAEDVDIDGYVYLGVSSASDPTTVSGAQQIQAKSKHPDLRNLRQLVTLYL